MSGGWDLIVVGAGSAGAVVAARSAARGKRVLLLEAGPDYRSAEMPEVWRSPNPLRALLDPTAGERLLQAGLHASRTEKQEPAPYTQGRGAGGSSSVNGHIAIRPPVEDFADWAAAGCTGWAPDDVLPYLVGMESDADFGDAPYHGSDGPIPIHRNFADAWGPVDHALHDAARDAGFGWAPDVNAPGATGVSPYPTNARNRRRVSTNDGYLEPARPLDTLTVRGDTPVDRVLFDGTRAVGVRTRSGDEYADRVVLSAGAVHSPTVLMRSGVGPAGVLRPLGVDVVRDLPVGEGLQDHALSFVGMPLGESVVPVASDARYTNVCVRYSGGDPDGAPQDMMLVAGNQNVLNLARADSRRGAGAMLVWLNRAYSRGHLEVASTDPEAQPVLRHRMLSDPRDVPRLREGVRLLVGLARSAPGRAVTDGTFDEVNADLLAVLDDDALLDDHLLATVADGQHATSTCRMGDPDAPETVVDPGFGVLGTDGLHVVDASVLPFCPRANPNVMTIALGEMAADLL